MTNDSAMSFDNQLKNKVPRLNEDNQIAKNAIGSDNAMLSSSKSNYSQIVANLEAKSHKMKFKDVAMSSPTSSSNQ